MEPVLSPFYLLLFLNQTMTASSLTPDLTPEALAARYSLLCRATCPPDADNPAQRELSALQNLIEQ